MSEESGMSWGDAIKAMEEGKRVRNQYFTSNEFFEMSNGNIIAEDGCPMHGWYTGEPWQQVGWSVIEKQVA